MRERPIKTDIQITINDDPLGLRFRFGQAFVTGTIVPVTNVHPVIVGATLPV